MNNQIVQNVYELWEQIGNITNKLVNAEGFYSVSMGDSDWPNRIFNIKDDAESLSRILQLSKEGNLSEIVALPKPNNLDSHPSFEFVMKQTNMAIPLKQVSDELIPKPNIKQVKTESDAQTFADIATECFKYKIDSGVIQKIIKHLNSVRFFIYQEHSESLGCGFIFFDSNNNAGLHMIGTRPSGRGKGIAKSITEKLLIEAKEQNANYCVLHASIMGESIYKKLGFEPYGELETYKIRS